MKAIKQNSREHIRAIAQIDNYFNKEVKTIRRYMRRKLGINYIENEEYLERITIIENDKKRAFRNLQAKLK